MVDTKAIREAIEHSDHFDPSPAWLEKLASRVQMTEWLRQLLDENKRLKDANDDMFQNREKWRESHMLLEQEIEWLRQEMSKYRNEAGNERELSESIVAEREELIIENEQLQADKAVVVDVVKWIRQRFEEEWTYECGTGEAVEEILCKFEEIGIQVEFDEIALEVTKEG